MTTQTNWLQNQEEKRAILERLEKENQSLVDVSRSIAESFCLSFEHGLHYYGIPHCVSSDDIWEYLSFERNCTGNNRAMGAVFRKGFVRVGQTASRVKGHHNYEIKVWTTPSFVEKINRFRRTDAL